MLETLLSGGVKILEDWKIKIAVLWLIGEGTALAYMILMLLQPGKTEQIMAEVTPELLLIYAIPYFLVPLAMAFLSLTLNDKANRWSNIIVGIVLTGLHILDSVAAVMANPTALDILMSLSIIVAPALIIWYAWKSKQKA